MMRADGACKRAKIRGILLRVGTLFLLSLTQGNLFKRVKQIPFFFFLSRFFFLTLRELQNFIIYRRYLQRSMYFREFQSAATCDLRDRPENGTFGAKILVTNLFRYKKKICTLFNESKNFLLQVTTFLLQ